MSATSKVGIRLIAGGSGVLEWSLKPGHSVAKREQYYIPTSTPTNRSTVVTGQFGDGLPLAKAHGQADARLRQREHSRARETEMGMPACMSCSRSCGVPRCPGRRGSGAEGSCSTFLWLGDVGGSMSTSPSSRQALARAYFCKSDVEGAISTLGTRQAIAACAWHERHRPRVGSGQTGPRTSVGTRTRFWRFFLRGAKRPSLIMYLKPRDLICL